MTVSRTLSLKKRTVAPEKLGYFKWTEILPGQILLTNDVGEWHVLPQDEFDQLLAGELPDEHDDHDELLRKGFLREGLDVDGIADRLRRKKAFVAQGPHLHIIISTLRCNQSCKYCHASRTDMDKVETDMSLETAKKSVDIAMQTTSPYVNFEFTGGEPTVNMPVVKFVVEYSREKNKYENKLLEHSIVTNMTYMTEENANWLIDNQVWVCTSLDGPEELHDWNRPWKKSTTPYRDVIKWIHRFNEIYIEKGYDPELYHVDALMTTTRKSLDQWKELVDLYVDLGIRNIHIRPLNPFGFANKTWKRIGYTIEEYLEFYDRCLDYIIELNLQGVQIMEGTARTFLKKMLTPDDPNFVDIRSPIGSGTGQVCYYFDGNIYPSDEGRMLAGMGDDSFLLGNVNTSTYEEVVNHPTVKTMFMASLLESLPACNTCFNAPYCGVRPLHNYMNTGDLFGQRPTTPKCIEHMHIAKVLFAKMIGDPSGRVETIFRRWTVDRPRPATEGV